LRNLDKDMVLVTIIEKKKIKGFSLFLQTIKISLTLIQLYQGYGKDIPISLVVLTSIFILTITRR